MTYDEMTLLKNSKTTQKEEKSSQKSRFLINNYELCHTKMHNIEELYW